MANEIAEIKKEEVTLARRPPTIFILSQIKNLSIEVKNESENMKNVKLNNFTTLKLKEPSFYRKISIKINRDLIEK
jgi:hypothetical protein